MNLKTLALAFLLAAPCFAEEKSPFESILDRLMPDDGDPVEKTAEDVIDHLAAGDHEAAVDALLQFSEEMRKASELLPPMLSETEDGAPLLYTGPVDQVLPLIIRNREDFEPLVLFEMLGTLFNAENQGGGYRFNVPCLRYFFHQIDRFPAMDSHKRSLNRLENLGSELEKLSPDGLHAANLALINWVYYSHKLIFVQERRTLIQGLPHSTALPESTKNAVICGLVLKIGARQSSSSIHSSFTPNYFKGRDSFLAHLNDEAIPIQFRFPAVWLSGYGGIGALNDPEALATMIDIAERSETEFGYPTASHENYLFHSGFRSDLANPDCLKLASDALSGWSERALQPSDDFPTGKVPQHPLRSALALFSTSKDYEKISSCYDQHGGEWCIGDSTIILSLIAAGDFETAETLIPEDFAFKEIEEARYSTHLADQLDAFFAEREDLKPAHLALLGRVFSSWKESPEALRGEEIGLLSLPEKIAPLLAHLDSIPEAEGILALSGFARFPNSLHLAYEPLENFATDCFSNIPRYSNRSIINFHATRFIAAYQAGEWERATQYFEDILSVFESNERAANTAFYVFLKHSGSLVANDLLEADAERQIAARDFWRNVATSVCDHPISESWFDRESALSFALLLDAVATPESTNKQWLKSLPKDKKKEIQELRQSKTSSAILLFGQVNDYSTDWRHPIDGYEKREKLMNLIYGNPNILSIGKELYALRIFDYSGQLHFEAKDRETFAQNTENDLLATAFCTQGTVWMYRYDAEQRKFWLPLVVSHQERLSPETSEVGRKIWELLEVARASIIGRDGDPAAGLEILDSLKGDLHPELQIRIDMARKTLSSLKN